MKHGQRHLDGVVGLSSVRECSGAFVHGLPAVGLCDVTKNTKSAAHTQVELWQFRSIKAPYF